MPDTTLPTHAPEASLKSRVIEAITYLHDRRWGRILIGVMLAMLVLVAKNTLLEPMAWYDEAKLATYEQIQHFLTHETSGRAAVRIVDISKIKRDVSNAVSPDEDSVVGPAVSRQALLAVLKNVAKSHPRAIAVDVDFSPNIEGSPVTADDLDYFEKYRKVSITEKVPIFLGVDRQAASKSEAWLGSSAYQDMAVGLGIGNAKIQGPSNEISRPVDMVLRMFCWTRSAPVTNHLPSLAYASSIAYRAPSQDPNPWLEWAIEFKSGFEPVPELQTEGFLVNYRLLDSLRRSAVPVNQVVSGPQIPDFEGQIVILGVVSRIPDDGRSLSRESDLFRVPGRKGYLYSGSLLHGCAVDTLIESPLRKWTSNGRIVSDLLLALCAIGLIEFLSWFFYERVGKKRKHFRIHWSVTLVISAAIGTVAIPFAGNFSLAWDDAAFVAIGLIAHTGLDHVLSNYVHHQQHEHPKSEEVVEPVDEEPPHPEPPATEETKTS